jgi:hypothetical protein
LLPEGRASVESDPGELVVGNIGRSSVKRFRDPFIIAAEFLLNDIRPAAVDRKPNTGGFGFGVNSQERESPTMIRIGSARQRLTSDRTAIRQRNFFVSSAGVTRIFSLLSVLPQAKKEP